MRSLLSDSIIIYVHDDINVILWRKNNQSHDDMGFILHEHNNSSQFNRYDQIIGAFEMKETMNDRFYFPFIRVLK